MTPHLLLLCSLEAGALLPCLSLLSSLLPSTLSLHLSRPHLLFHPEEAMLCLSLLPPLLSRFLLLHQLSAAWEHPANLLHLLNLSFSLLSLQFPLLPILLRAEED